MTRYPKSAEFARRAQRVIPGGHHLTGRPLVDFEATPSYFEWAKGAYVRDVDGFVYVDWLMAFGPYLLGYAQQEVDEAAHEAGKQGRLVSLNHPRHVEFIEALLPLFPGAEMGCFFRNGSEATTAALRIARRATGRRRVVRCGYHGWHDWCLPLEDFVPDGLQRQVLEFDANHPRSLETIFAEYPGEIAGVVLAPEMMLPISGEKLRTLGAITKRHGAVFIMDEVKTGFRSPKRCLSAHFDVAPDLLTLSKAMGNGWPVAALVGARSVLEHAAGLHISGTFHGDVAAMAAALRTATLIEEYAAASHAARVGQALIDGLIALGKTHSLPVEAYPEPIAAMPFMRFVHDDPVTKKQLTDTFYAEVLKRGVLLHPRHLWFPSLAHTDSDLQRTLEAADAAMVLASRCLQ